MKDRRPEAQTDYPTAGGEPRRRYPPPPRPGARAARAARAATGGRAGAAPSSEEPTGRPAVGRAAVYEGGLDHDAERESPTLFAMVGIVAVSVALIILLSFAAGYGFGRYFL